MKYLTILFILISSLTFGQSKDTKGGEFEIYTEIREGTPGIDFVKFELYNTGKIWENTLEEILPLVTNLNYAHACTRNDYGLINIPTPTPDNGWEYGIFHTISFSPGNYPSDVVFGNEKYKLKITETTTGESFYFYLDYTTDNYTYGGDNDIWVKYYIENNTVQVKWGNSDAYHSIDKGKTYKIWEKKGIARSTEKLELYIILTNRNNHPYLHWNSYHDPNIIGYYLYREVTTKNNSVLDKLPINATSYLDIEILLGSSSSAVAKYWVKARINSTTESLAGNRVSTSGEFQPQKISTDNKREKKSLQFRLSANFPNPFNPSTTITYELPEKEYVTLKVYNSLGKEVAVLVEGQKEAGNYSITFNAKSAAGGLPSGIYFYKLTTGNFTKVRKMILMK